MLDVKNVFVKENCIENPDWGHARNKRILMRTSRAEFSASIFAARMGDFLVQNKDYPYEGLCALVDSENWKFLDSLAFAIKLGDNFLALTPKHVQIFPWKSIFHFSIDGADSKAELAVEYYLLRGGKSANLCVSFHVSSMASDKLRLLVEPLVDIRHMYSASNPNDHLANELPLGIEISKEGKHLAILSKDILSKNLSPRHQGWNYKLGNGSREYGNGGKIAFKAESRELFVPGTLVLKFTKGKSQLQLLCNPEKKSKHSIELKDHDEKKFLAKLTRQQKPYLHELKNSEQFGRPNQLALQGRLFNLLEGFDFENSSLQAPDAGAFWFRNIWFRDLFVGINDNFDIYYKNKKAYVRSMLLNSLKMQKQGLIPNKFSESKDGSADYSTADATLLCFICCLKYLSRANDAILQRELKSSVKSFLQSLSNGKVRIENYLLKTPANYSWIDSKRNVKFFGADLAVPCRIPDAWLLEIATSSKNLDEFTSKISSPRYYLVEINALWIRFLTDFQSIYPSPEFEALLANAKINFKTFFFADNSASIIDEDFKSDCTSNSPLAYSAAQIPELFTTKEIGDLIKRLETTFVYRNRKLFGLLTSNAKNRIFLGDNEYHGAVIWPRESPALLRLLTLLKDPRASEILESNLEHQMEEGAVFFNQELFALPEGENPSPQSTSYSPVPVRNPAQYWSQWVQPYFDYLRKKD